jgi:hypothetical protein
METHVILVVTLVEGKGVTTIEPSSVARSQFPGRRTSITPCFTIDYYYSPVTVQLARQKHCTL